ncbi:MAG: SDR family NAD(P)-dependent oxidoreductase, partial [bacterium]
MDTAALITGASRGIGLELARCFARDGDNCVIVARSEDRLHEIKDEFESEYSVSVKVIPKDLTQDSACEDIHDELDQEDHAERAHDGHEFEARPVGVAPPMSRPRATRPR